MTVIVEIILPLPTTVVVLLLLPWALVILMLGALVLWMDQVVRDTGEDYDVLYLRDA